MHAENIRDRPPIAEEWWEDAGAFDTIDLYQEVDDGTTTGLHSTPKIVVNAQVSSRHKKFHNCGYETWVRAREEWKQQTVDTIPERPALVERSQLVKGLKRATLQRTYELPRRVRLSDLIRVYHDIWDGDDD